MRGGTKYIVILMLLLFGVEASAQQMKERGWVRKGNRQYERENYDGSIESYKEALKHDPTSFEAKYDLASALYRAKRFDTAESTLKELLEGVVKDDSRSETERGEVAYNLGNTQFAQQKYKEALSSYRYAMRCNPNDEDAKFNYAFTKRLLQQQQQQQQDQNQENKENKDNKDKSENKDQQSGEDKQNQNQNQQESDPQNEQKRDAEGNGTPVEAAMSPEQQDAILQAIQAEEDKTQDKLKEKRGVIIRGSKNW